MIVHYYRFQYFLDWEEKNPINFIHEKGFMKPFSILLIGLLFYERYFPTI